MQLAGNVAIVTGGSKGIGYAVADYLMAHGADVERMYGTTRGNAHYAAAKAGILKFTQVAALEAGRYGIRVNSVSPGVVPAEGARPRAMTEAFHRSFAIDRMGEPSDLAKAVAFLASDYAAWITGVDLLVDGGTHLRGLPDYAEHLLGGNG